MQTNQKYHFTTFRSLRDLLQACECTQMLPIMWTYFNMFIVRWQMSWTRQLRLSTMVFCLWVPTRLGSAPQETEFSVWKSNGFPFLSSAEYIPWWIFSMPLTSTSFVWWSSWQKWAATSLSFFLVRISERYLRDRNVARWYFWFV